MSLLRNSGYTLAASLAPVLISFVTVPVFIHAMGEARYGVIAIFAMLLGYFGVLDLGLSRAVAQRIAAGGGARSPECGEIFWSGALVNLALGLAGGAVVLPVARWVFDGQIKVPPELRPEMLAAAPWLALAVPLALMTQVLRGAMQGAQRFAALNAITTATAVFSQLASVVTVVWFTPALPVVLPIMFMTRLLDLATMGWQVLRHVLPNWRPAFRKRRALDLLSFGGWVALSGVVSPLMTTLDRFLIGSVVNAGAVSHYTVPYQLGERTQIVPAAVSDALFPRVASLSIAEARDLASRTMSVLSAIMTPALVGGIVILQIFLSLWISPAFAAEAALPGRILMAGFCLNSFAFAFLVCLQAGGNPRLVAIAHVIEVVPFLVVLYFGLRLWGLPGAAAAFALRVAADSFLLAHFARALRHALTLSAAPVALLALALAVGPAVRTDSPIGMAMGAGTVLLSAAFGYRRLAAHGFTLASLWTALRQRRTNAAQGVTTSA